jgi:hypothetical protein
LTQDLASIKVLELSSGENIFECVSSLNAPVVIKGLVADWPVVHKSQLSNQELDGYLRQFNSDAPVQAFVGNAGTDSRISYTKDLSSTSFKQVQTKLAWVLDQIRDREEEDSGPVCYMGSTALDYCLPGFSRENYLSHSDIDPSIRIWIGNRTKVAAHFDTLDNVACVCAGSRRFTLFPPDQLDNLYVGPIDFTPAGQAISLVDVSNPNFDQYPRFAEALNHAQTAVLEPGDAIFIPSMWWHHVESLSNFNVLINYWWRESPLFMGAPHDALLHAILSIRDLPQEQRDAWRGIFDHYVFNTQDNGLDHIPGDAKGVLGPLDEDAARKLRTLLRNKLNR